MANWIQSRIIHSPDIPYFFDGNYELPIDFWYIAENTRVTFVCHACQGNGLGSNDIERIENSIMHKLRKEFPKHNIFHSVSKEEYEKRTIIT